MVLTDKGQRAKNIFNLLLAQEMSRSFGGLYFAKQNKINFKI